jgi:hypothetical protein
MSLEETLGLRLQKGVSGCSCWRGIGWDFKVRVNQQSKGQGGKATWRHSGWTAHFGVGMGGKQQTRGGGWVHTGRCLESGKAHVAAVMFIDKL